MILTRSPYYITGTHPSALSAVLDLTIYSGEKISLLLPITYSIKKTAVNTDRFFIFEISELVEDFITKTFTGDYVTEAVWVKYNLSLLNDGGIEVFSKNDILDAVSGYREFENSNQDEDITILQTTREVNLLVDGIFKLPVKTNSGAIIKFLDINDNVLGTFILTNKTNSKELVTYISNDGGYNILTYSDRLGVDGYEYFPSTCTDEIFNSFRVDNINSITVESIARGLQRIEVVTLEDCKYTPRKVTFINKFGVLQDLFFLKKSVEALTTKRETYKSNILNASTGSYSPTRHNNIDYNITANESLKLSSGFVPEIQNEVFKELLLSERIWITEGLTITPVNIMTSNLQYKTVLNDKLIEYTIDFKKSYNTISNVR